MKKILVLQLTLLFLSVYAFATPISESEAREKAVRFIHSKKGTSAARSAQRFGGAASLGATLTNVESQEAYYVFNVDSVNGYVIVSGDDRMPDVLGYSYHGTYNAEDIPDNMRAWLQGYADEYQYLQTHGDAKGASLTSVEGGAVRPLLECRWNQPFPYNNLCPMINGERAVTGCVATAMAQVMYYHKWPKQTINVIPEYKTKSEGIYMSQIGITAIDWDNMISLYGNKGGTYVQNQAVAKLMLLCGCAVQMDYGQNASSAYCDPKVLTDYFGYNKLSVSEVIRRSYASDVWNQMIYDELKDGRPVLYSGQGSDVGHEFVIDGYDKNNYFHINWGWGGYQDNYFLLSSLNGYNYDQVAIIGIASPGNPDHKYAYAELLGETLTFYYDNESETRTGMLFNINNHEWTNENLRNTITTVEFDSSFGDCRYLISTADMFNDMNNLSSVQGLENLNTQNVTDMSWMFYGCRSLTCLDLSNFDTQNVTKMAGMFCGCSSLQEIYTGENWSTQKVASGESMFNGCYELIGERGTQFTYRNTDFNYAHIDGGKENPGYLSTKGFSYPHAVFDEDSKSLTFYYGNGRDFPESIRIKSYSDCTERGWDSVSESIETVEFDLSLLDCNDIVSTSYWFYNCENLTTIQGLENLNTQNVTDMRYMFYGCKNLTSLDVCNFDTRNVESMNYMFCDCSSLTSLDVRKFNTQNVTSLSGMFFNCKNLTSLDVSNFDTRKVTNMYCLFYNCSNLRSLDVSKFDTKDVTNMGYMFCGCYSLETIYAGEKWNTASVENSDYMFGGCSSLVGQDGTKYNYNYMDKMKAHYGAGGYLTYKSAALRGDANGDREIGMPDVMFIVNYILGTPDPSFNTEAADANHDGEVGMPDVMFIVNYILNGEFPKE